jgi:hypothetical protein
MAPGSLNGRALSKSFKRQDLRIEALQAGVYHRGHTVLSKADAAP